MNGIQEKTDFFTKLRPRLFGIAYRMLGTRDDAEDIVQEAYLRWHRSDAAEVENPEAWLVTIATRLSIDRLRKAAAERERYIGPWLPEPIPVRPEPSPDEQLEFASDLSLAFMALLERLSPQERAVFLLHDIFECGYADVAKIVGKTEPAVRKMLQRARERVRNDRQRYRADERKRASLIRKFYEAARAASESQLLSLFTEDAMLTTDGGGKATAARKVVEGPQKIAHLYATVSRKGGEHVTVRLIMLNGEIGTLEYYDGLPYAVTAYTIEGDRIAAMHRVMNPDKLKAFYELDVDLHSRQVSQIAPGIRLDM